jgi:histidinol-phosphatase (PHP family)
MYITDYHIHTDFSDGRSAPEDFAAAAIKAGLDEIGFSDHLTLTGENQKWSIDPGRLPEYFNRIHDLGRNTQHIKILAGIEADYLPGKENEIQGILTSYPFDYVLGSVHYMGTETVDLGREFYEGKNIDRLFENYFQLVAAAAASGLFDIIAHPDLIRIYGYRYSKDPVPLYRNLAKTFRSHDVAFEINTNGRNKPLGDFYPDRRFLHLFAEEGVPLCINSDAHMPSRVGQHFSEARQLALDAGFTETALFSNRKRTMIPLIVS